MIILKNNESLFFLFSAFLFIFFPWLHGLNLLWEQFFSFALIFLFSSFSILTLQKNFSRYDLLLLSSLFTPAIFSFLYQIPLPLYLLDILSPSVAEFYINNTDLNYGFLTVYRFTSFVESIKYICLPLIFIFFKPYFREIRNIRITLFIIFIGAFLIAIYSLLNFFSSGKFAFVSAIPPWDYPWSQGIRGTFSYKNHNALYITFSIFICLAFILSDIHLKKMRMKIVFLVFSFLLLFYELLNAGSRSVLISMLLSVFLCTLHYYLSYGIKLSQLIFKKSKFFISLIAIFLLYSFLKSTTITRFLEDSLSDNGRYNLSKTAFKIWIENPIFGTGPGTYPYIQHIYKTPDLGISKMSIHPHNDYLETLSNFGVLGFLSFGIFLLYILIKIFNFNKNQYPLLLYSCRAILLTFLIQSIFDTNLGIFFMPILFFTILTIAYALVVNFNDR